MKFPLTIIFLLITPFLFAQVNLVPNPSFEVYDTCPDYFGQVYRATGWHMINDCDYMNSCAPSCSCITSFCLGVPQNYAGFQNAATGNAYVLFEAWRSDTIPQFPSYVGRQLSVPLIVGNKYYVSIKVSMAYTDPSCSSYANCGTDNIGVLFTQVHYNDTAIVPPTPLLRNFAHIYSTQVILDTLNWSVISGTFIADSAYDYILIGRFWEYSMGTVICMDSRLVNISGYYLDDVCVSSDSLTCNPTDAINEINHKVNLINVYPNPTTNELTIDFAITDNSLFELYDVIGAKRKAVTLDCGSLTKRIDLTDIDSGLYFYSVVDRKGNRIKTGKLIVIK